MGWRGGIERFENSRRVLSNVAGHKTCLGRKNGTKKACTMLRGQNTGETLQVCDKGGGRLSQTGWRGQWNIEEKCPQKKKKRNGQTPERKN